MKNARIIRTNEPLLVEEVAIPRPKYDQVVVRVQSAGVCHSDLHLWEGAYAGPGGSFIKVEDRGLGPCTPEGIYDYRILYWQIRRLGRISGASKDRKNTISDIQEVYIRSSQSSPGRSQDGKKYWKGCPKSPLSIVNHDEPKWLTFHKYSFC